MSDLMNRMLRAAKLDINLYEEVEADKGAMGQAMGVVVLSSLAAGIGAIQQTGVKGIIFGTITALIGWYIWAYITYFIGTKLLPEPQTEADHGEAMPTGSMTRCQSSDGIYGMSGNVWEWTEINMSGELHGDERK